MNELNSRRLNRGHTKTIVLWSGLWQNQIFIISLSLRGIINNSITKQILGVVILVKFQKIQKHQANNTKIKTNYTQFRLAIKNFVITMKAAKRSFTLLSLYKTHSSYCLVYKGSFAKCCLKMFTFRDS